MSRKHENFTYNYGWKTAPEQWHFYLNNKLIQLDNSTRNELACMCISGKVKEAEDQLKRILRKEEKQNVIKRKCIAFYGKNSRQFYYTKQLAFIPGDRERALYSFKEWKRYIKKQNMQLETIEVTSGYITPYGVTKGKREDVKHIIDLNRKCMVNIFENPDNVCFPCTVNYSKRIQKVM